MSNEIAKTTDLSNEALQTLFQAGVIPKDTPKAQVEIFARVCSEKELSPFTKEVYLVGYGGKYSIITGIDGFRKIAERTGLLAGIDDAKFDLQSDGTYRTPVDFKKDEKPKSATVTIWKNVGGVRCPFTHTAVFSEFSGSGKWQSMPFQMIAKVAEAFALRKGFSSSLAGLREDSEIPAMSGEAVNVGKAPSETNRPTAANYFDADNWLENQKANLNNVADFNSCVEGITIAFRERSANANEDVKKLANIEAVAKKNALTVYAASVGIVWNQTARQFENAKTETR